jgi:tetratricopeptide (TPR) repeat protein
MLIRTLFILSFLSTQLHAATNPAAEAAFQRATTEAKFGKWVAAASSYQSAASYDPGMALAWRGLGYSLYQLGKKEGCILAYDHYLQLVPGDKAMAAYVSKMRATLPASSPAATVPLAAAPVMPAEAVQWRKMKGAAADSKASGKPILYFCGGDWAAPSRRMTRQIFAKAENAHWINQTFVPVNIEVPRLIREKQDMAYEETKLLDHYFVRSIPTLIVEYPNGRAADLIHGSRDGEETMKKLRAFLEKKG